MSQIRQKTLKPIPPLGDGFADDDDDEDESEDDDEDDEDEDHDEEFIPASDVGDTDADPPTSAHVDAAAEADSSLVEETSSLQAELEPPSIPEKRSLDKVYEGEAGREVDEGGDSSGIEWVPKRAKSAPELISDSEGPQGS